MLDIAKHTPPVDNKLSRFGNPAFKTFYDRVGEVSREWCVELSPGVERSPRENTKPPPGRHRRDRRVLYRVVGEQAAGRLWQRDGAELFVLAVGCRGVNVTDNRLCLHKLGLVLEEDFTFVVLGVFWR